MKTFLLTVPVFAFFALTAAGCAEKGPGERAGERIDEISDNIAEGRAPLHHAGPVERAGRSVDRGLNRAGRALEDATDND